jgi:sortase A
VVDESAAGQPAPRRPNRFDRPPVPHDWRWLVGGIGRVLISLGVLMFAFVAYQLWGTGIQTARAQDELGKSFDDMLATASSPAPATTAAALPVAPTTTVTVTDPAGGATVTTTAGPPTTTGTDPDTGTDTDPTAGPLAGALAARPAAGEPLARLEIPAIGIDKIVVEGVQTGDLRKGPGHFPETPLPGEYGNASIAGHRTTYGQPFYDIDQIVIGDEIAVTTLAGRFVYVVDDISIVGADDYALVVPTVDPTKATLTLSSCHPKYSAKLRYIVRASIDPTRSDQVSMPTFLPAPDAVDPGQGALPTDQPATTEIAPSTSVDAAAQPTATSVAGPVPSAPTTTPPVTPPPVTVTDPAPATASVDDSEAVFGSQWFSNDDAFVPAALWGFRLMVVAFIATAISRFARRNWVGALVGIVPFIICLYFFFEDLSRLLPANL